MLSALRTKKNHPLIGAFLVAIILVFIFFFGTRWSGCESSSVYAAKVNGEIITDREFSQRYSSVFRSYQQQYGQFDRKAAESMDLRRHVLDQMLTSRILAAEARKGGLAVDEEALRQAILEDKSFQVDGRFDRERYERILNQSGLSAGEYELSLRSQILAGALGTFVQSSTYLSSNELKQSLETKGTTLDLSFVRVPFEAFVGKAAAPSDEDAQKWLTDTADAQDRITKSYQKHAATKYNVPKKVHARHILVRADRDTPYDLKQKANEKIIEARHAIVDQKMDFAEAAKKYSEDPSAERGGDLGFFSRGQMVGPFEEAAFALKPGELSQIVETPFGYHLIKIEEIQEPIERKLDDVKVEIAKDLIREEKAQSVAEARAKEIDGRMRAGETLEVIVGASDPDGLKAEDTGPFNGERDYIPRIGLDKSLARAAWKLTPEHPLPEGPAKTDTAWVVFKLKEKKSPSAEELAQARSEVLPSLMLEKRGLVLEDWSKSLLTRAKVERNPIALSYDESVRSARKRQ
ncbi:MAG: SurA N-terminal domain-containing protein [Deltaproteobacteria bacterium]|nr:SurA N-terminal domain-containing protein [Deltaproteobacteria bacterium]